MYTNTNMDYACTKYVLAADSLNLSKHIGWGGAHIYVLHLNCQIIIDYADSSIIAWAFHRFSRYTFNSILCLCYIQTSVTIYIPTRIVQSTCLYYLAAML